MEKKWFRFPVKLMEFVEHGELDGDTLEAYFREHLTPYLTEDTETIVLGCTHYPFLRRYLRKFLGERKIDLIDGSWGRLRNCGAGSWSRAFCGRNPGSAAW